MQLWTQMVPTTVVRIVIISWMIFLIVDQFIFIIIYSLNCLKKDISPPMLGIKGEKKR